MRRLYKLLRVGAASLPLVLGSTMCSRASSLDDVVVAPAPRVEANACAEDRKEPAINGFASYLGKSTVRDIVGYVFIYLDANNTLERYIENSGDNTNDESSEEDDKTDMHHPSDDVEHDALLTLWNKYDEDEEEEIGSEHHVLMFGRPRIMSLARIYLSDPERLSNIYQEYKDTIICAVRAEEKEQLVKDYLLKAVELHKSLDEVLEHDSCSLGWFLKRRAEEGGNKLAATWLGIMKDLGESLAGFVPDYNNENKTTPSSEYGTKRDLGP